MSSRRVIQEKNMINKLALERDVYSSKGEARVKQEYENCYAFFNGLKSMRTEEYILFGDAAEKVQNETLKR